MKPYSISFYIAQSFSSSKISTSSIRYPNKLENNIDSSLVIVNFLTISAVAENPDTFIALTLCQNVPYTLAEYSKSEYFFDCFGNNATTKNLPLDPSPTSTDVGFPSELLHQSLSLSDLYNSTLLGVMQASAGTNSHLYLFLCLRKFRFLLSACLCWWKYLISVISER